MIRRDQFQYIFYNMLQMAQAAQMTTVANSRQSEKPTTLDYNLRFYNYNNTTGDVDSVFNSKQFFV